jgi:hypothetical protein
MAVSEPEAIATGGCALSMARSPRREQQARHGALLRKDLMLRGDKYVCFTVTVKKGGRCLKFFAEGGQAIYTCRAPHGG